MLDVWLPTAEKIKETSNNTEDNIEILEKVHMLQMNQCFQLKKCYQKKADQVNLVKEVKA